MSRTHRTSAPWTLRALRGELPASDRTGRIPVESYTTRSERMILGEYAAETLGHRVALATRSPRTYTIADLQRADRRENGQDR